MAETWTEYAVRKDDGSLAHEDIPALWMLVKESKEAAIESQKMLGGTVVGRQVTASDWLPVDQGGAS